MILCNGTNKKEKLNIVKEFYCISACKVNNTLTIVVSYNNIHPNMSRHIIYYRCTYFVEKHIVNVVSFNFYININILLSEYVLHIIIYSGYYSY